MPKRKRKAAAKKKVTKKKKRTAKKKKKGGRKGKKKRKRRRTTLSEGQIAPSFTVQTDDGRTVSLADFRGSKVVLYFYPKDDTPGCTKEACAFRDGIARIKAKGAKVLGVSVDDVDSHRKFRDKYQLNFPLLADTEKKIVQDYGVWKEKSMYGRTYMGIERTTYLIDENGKILKIFPKVDVNAHYEEVLQALE